MSYQKLLTKRHGTLNGDGEGDFVDDRYITISVSIGDEFNNMEFILSTYKELGQGEKAVKVKGIYEGKERMDKNSSGCGGSGVAFLVNNRFEVGLSSGLCDLAVLHQIIDSMNLESLPK